jgi:Holliday junction resolvase-like predicted endonuclease
LEFFHVDFERQMIISVLKSTKNGAVLDKLVKNGSKIPKIAAIMLRKLRNEGLIYLQNGVLEADGHQRLQLAVRAIELGVDVESISGLLLWKEFEGMAAVALERNGYSVKKSLRFKQAGRRWEIDVVGCKRPVVLCVDCKHWQHGMHASAIKKTVEDQVKRTSALAKSLPNPSWRIDWSSWDRVKLIPAVLSLVAGRFRFYDHVPIVPVLQLQDFLNQLPAYADSLRHSTRVNINRLDVWAQG